ncbi:trans-sialidase [Trypanosoma cruzi]|nr:trans-sialidase [Trypanosoma cruzi]
MRCVPAAGCGCIPLAVGLNWRRWRCVSSRSCPLVVDCWRCVRLLCGGPNPLTRGLTALRWFVCVRAGVESLARARAFGDAFPACLLFLPSVCAASCSFPLSPSPPVFLRGVAACSRAMLIVSASWRHPSPSLPLPVCLSFPVGCGVLHRVRAGPHTPTARRDLPCCSSFLWAMVLRAVPSDCLVPRSLRGCSALLLTDLSGVLPLLLLFSNS